MPSHTEIKTPVRGLFGIGTSHGGPGTHSDPIVITKDFDRDTLEFVDEGQVQVCYYFFVGKLGKSCVF